MRGSTFVVGASRSLVATSEQDACPLRTRCANALPEPLIAYVAKTTTPNL